MTVGSLFNLTGEDLLLILLIVVLLFGAKKLPHLTKNLGQSVREFTKAKDEFEREVTRPIEPTDRPPTPTRPWRFILARLHDGYAAAVAAPFPLSH